MKFVLKLPLKDPRLKFEVYDFNVASSDDPISSACLSLRDFKRHISLTALRAGTSEK